MSINHYSSPDIQEATLWWNSQQHHHQSFLMQPTQNASHHPPSWPSQHLYPPPPPPRFSLNHHDIIDDEEDDDEHSLHLANEAATSEGGKSSRGEEKEGMFEKPLTPSDVGKLNRLVIPKQHAEKYFPLAAAGGEVGGGESKGVSLSFEDEEGKCWRFRYSYWNSSQSYVLTKGWSRYVKDKRLDAGDVVLFLRHRTDSNRLFIHWRRRLPSNSSAPTRAVPSATDANGNVGVSVGWTRSFYASQHPYPTHHQQALPYQPNYLHAGVGLEEEQNKTAASPAGNNSSSRILRLFGVDMECQPQDSSGPEYSYMSSTTSFQDTASHPHHHLYGHYSPQSASNYSSHHMVRQQPQT